MTKSQVERDNHCVVGDSNQQSVLLIGTVRASVPLTTHYTTLSLSTGGLPTNIPGTDEKYSLDFLRLGHDLKSNIYLS